jgi:hypothetical protein
MAKEHQNGRHRLILNPNYKPEVAALFHRFTFPHEDRRRYTSKPYRVAGSAPPTSSRSRVPKGPNMLDTELNATALTRLPGRLELVSWQRSSAPRILLIPAPARRCDRRLPCALCCGPMHAQQPIYVPL